MISDTTRTLAYVCPHCRQSVIAQRSSFVLLAGRGSIPCPCGNSVLKTQIEEDRLLLTVPCLYCQKEHQIACSLPPLLEEKTLGFSCSISGLDCCYIGDEDAVFAAMTRLEEATHKLQTEGESLGMFLDEIMMEECLCELKDIAQRGGISCTCGETEWQMRIHYSSIDLSCPTCGGALRIPAATADDLSDLCCKATLSIQRR